MNNRMRRGCLGWALAGALILTIGTPRPALAQREPLKITEIEIRHVGPPATSDALIRANIRVKVGESYNPAGSQDDVRSLYSTGFFYNIRVHEEPTSGGVKLIYQVQGKPVLTQIQFTGNRKFSQRKLLKKLSSKIGAPLDERKLFNDAQEIVKAYQKSGYQKTACKYVPNIDERAGRGTVTFEITEAPKLKIDNVEFVGATAFTQGKLRRVIKTRRHWFFSWLTGSGVFKDDQFQEDREKLADFYRNEGYLDFEIKEVQLEPVKPNWIVLKVQVREGTQYRVGSVEFQGNQVLTTNDLLTQVVVQEDRKYRRGLSTGPGKVFTPRGLMADREGLEDLYGARGYIDAAVLPARVPNTAQSTMDLVYRIEEGSKSYIEKVEIRGNTKTKDKVIRRELAVSPGETFDMVRVKLSTNRLYGLNYFEKVDAQPEPTDVKDRKNLVISVEEKSTGDIRMGAGFSSVESLVGFVELSQGNFDLFKPPYFTGGGQKLRLKAQYGTRLQDYQITFIEPWFLNRKLSFGVDLYHRELSYYSTLYDTRQTGVRFNLTRALWRDFWVGNISYTIENIGIIDVDPGAPLVIRAEEGNRLVSKVGAGLAYDTRNSTTLPNRGQRTALYSEVAGSALGGDTDLYKVELTSSHYFRGLAEGHVLELNGRVGVVDSYNDSRIPLFDRWFLGGQYTLRGFKYRKVGPYDATLSEPVGGGTYWMASAEYSIPIIERLRFAVFYDIGNVYPDAYSFRTAGPDYGAYSDNWGLGIRLNIPGMGPLRLDYGLPITRDRFVSGSGRFQFGVGYTREF